MRVFREDVLVCPCGGRRVVLAFITEKKVVKEILEHLAVLAAMWFVARWVHRRRIRNQLQAE